jgi:hypothetical protein
VVATELTAAPPACRSWATPASRHLSLPRLVILLFLVAQGWDGVFTYMAVHAYGITAEGNAIIATWMHLIGPVPALVGAKTLACLCGVLLYVRGVHHALAGLTVLYAVSAVGPWIAIFARL